MKRTLFLCAIVAIALATHVSQTTAATKKADIKLFTVKLTVVETKDGQEHALAEPVMVVREGEAASFLSGGELPDPVKNDASKVDIEYVPYGLQARLTVRELAADKLHVSLNVSNDVLSYEKNGDVNIRQSGARCFRTIRAGDAIVLDMGDGRTAKMVVTPTATTK